MDKDVEQKIQDLQNQINELKGQVADVEEATKDQLSIAIVSGDMDRILAAMVLSIAAASMDTQVKLFFSFWSLSALRDKSKRVKCLDLCCLVAWTN